MPRRIALIGYRASGKSSLGPRLACALEWNFVDMDEVLSESMGLSIAAWVERYGWEAFRREETRLLVDLSRRRNIVAATGGGVVEKEVNRTILRQNFFTVWLRCGVQTLCRRLASDENTPGQRPSLTGRSVVEETSEVLHRRRPWYEATAHLVVDTDRGSPEELVDIIVRHLESLESF